MGCLDLYISWPIFEDGPREAMYPQIRYNITNRYKDTYQS